jgi:hypothetical protein
MTVPDEKVASDDLVAAAREIIRGEGDRCIVSISELLDKLEDQYGDQFRVSPDTCQVLQLIRTLWEDPHIDQVSHMWDIEFAWNEEGYYPESDSVRGSLISEIRRSATDCPR